eukprot:2542751-Pyramimonas_sp.AAC.1
MVQGKELDHLHELLRHADYRGSDVRLVSGQLVDGCRREFPCPAPAWRWETIMACPWRQQQHINVLEFIAFLVCFRRVVLDPTPKPIPI